MNRSYAGALTYIHKVKSGRDIYFFANSTDAAVDATVVLRGRRIWPSGTPTRANRRRQTSRLRRLPVSP